MSSEKHPGASRQLDDVVNNAPANSTAADESSKIEYQTGEHVDDALKFVLERGVSHVEVSESESRRLCRKLDLMLMPMVRT